MNKKIFVLMYMLLVFFTVYGQQENFYEKGYEMLQRKEYEKAIALFTAHIKTNAENTEALYYRAYAKYMLYDYKGSIADMDHVLKKSSNYYYYYFRGEVKFFEEDYQGSIIDLSISLKLNPNHVYSYYWRGKAKSELGNNYASAIDDLDKVLQQLPNSYWAFYERGVAKARAGRLQEACQDWQKANDLGHTRAYRLVKYNCGQ